METKLIRMFSLAVEQSELFVDGNSIQETIDKIKLLDTRMYENFHYPHKPVKCCFRIVPYGYDGAVEIYIDVMREETDAEVIERTRKEDAANMTKLVKRAKANKSEYAKYLEHKAKFETQLVKTNEKVEDTYTCNSCKSDEGTVELHSCPYKSEICGNDLKQCNCCSSCTHDCCMEI